MYGERHGRLVRSFGHHPAETCSRVRLHRGGDSGGAHAGAHLGRRLRGLSDLVAKECDGSNRDTLTDIDGVLHVLCPVDGLNRRQCVRGDALDQTRPVVGVGRAKHLRADCFRGLDSSDAIFSHLSKHAQQQHIGDALLRVVGLFHCEGCVASCCRAALGLLLYVFPDIIVAC